MTQIAGAPQGSTGDGRRRTIGLLASSAIELLVAWVLGRTLVTWTAGQQMRMGTHAGMGHGTMPMDGGRHTAAALTAIGIWAAVMVLQGVQSRAAVRGRRGTSRTMAVLAAAGSLVLMWPALASASSGSRLPMMAVLMTVMMVAPGMVVRALELPRRHVPAQLARARVPAAVVFSVLMVIAHLNPVMMWLMGSTARTSVYYLLCSLTGLLLWAVLLSGPADAGRARAVVIAGAPGALLALAFVLAPHAASGAATGLFASAVTDQRLGGALMMVTDAAAFVPMLGTGGRRPPVESLNPS